MKDEAIDYRSAGVDVDAGQKLVRDIGATVAATQGPEVLGNLGGFAGLYALGNYRDPVLVSGTDGVGTKVELARAAGRLNTIGIDLVAMCVNDVICHGARPLFFLDYMAVDSLKEVDAAAIVAGVAEGCRRAGCALIGGETAEMPGVYRPGRFDLAGFAVGAVERGEIIDGRALEPGMAVVGLASSGFHSNGYSLLRKLFPEACQEPEEAAAPETRSSPGEGGDARAGVAVGASQLPGDAAAPGTSSSPGETGGVRGGVAAGADASPNPNPDPSRNPNPSRNPDPNPGGPPAPGAVELRDALLTPTRIYAGVVAELTTQCRVAGIAHITGGGWWENLPRLLGVRRASAVGARGSEHGPGPSLGAGAAPGSSEAAAPGSGPASSPEIAQPAGGHAAPAGGEPASSPGTDQPAAGAGQSAHGPGPGLGAGATPGSSGTSPLRLVVDAGAVPLPDIIRTLVDTPLSPAEAYRTFNMGLGLAVALPVGEVQRAIGIATSHGIGAWEIGRVEEHSVPDGEAVPAEESVPGGETGSGAGTAGEPPGSSGHGVDPAISITGIPPEWPR